MKLNRSLFITLIVMIAVAALYRIMPSRPFGFAPQIAMALFGGAAIKDRAWAFALPIFSMFISDALYAALNSLELTTIAGFYQGQWINYIEFASIVVVGFMMKKISIKNIAVYSVIAPTWFFLISNFTVWVMDNGITYTNDVAGLVNCFIAGIPFYQNSVLATVLFSTVFFGAWAYMEQKQKATV